MLRPKKTELVFAIVAVGYILITFIIHTTS